MEAVDESSSLITDVVEQVSIGEQMGASEIKHAYHDHNLTLTFSGGEIKDESQCDGCMRPISTPFYSCEQCQFFLHKLCAELPRGADVNIMDLATSATKMIVKATE
ncbi:hypothetical protein V6N11_055639 [Hibiscus sabdariffa]|uniref:DC1 domain-containing protein n=2 Tax=Hibiscus sabdariffa TaxID=183260 RepID=A0ABR2NRA5_9ROSI